VTRLQGAGLILAGGTSRRMGREKLNLPWGGGTLLSRVAEVMTATMEEVWLVGYPQHGVPESPRLHPVVDSLRIGPVGGLLLGLEDMTFPKGVVVAADMPLIDQDAIRMLWELSHGASVTMLRTTDGLHPLLGVYGKECLPSLRAAIEGGARRVTGFWDGLAVRVLDVGDDALWNRVLQNINSLEDYHRACAVASQQWALDPAPSPDPPRAG